MWMAITPQQRQNSGKFSQRNHRNAIYITELHRPLNEMVGGEGGAKRHRIHLKQDWKRVVWRTLTFHRRSLCRITGDAVGMAINNRMQQWYHTQQFYPGSLLQQCYRKSLL
jgi:hypothetical protein